MECTPDTRAGLLLVERSTPFYFWFYNDGQIFLALIGWEENCIYAYESLFGEAAEGEELWWKGCLKQSGNVKLFEKLFRMNIRKAFQNEFGLLQHMLCLHQFIIIKLDKFRKRKIFKSFWQTFFLNNNIWWNLKVL